MVNSCGDSQCDDCLFAPVGGAVYTIFCCLETTSYATTIWLYCLYGVRSPLYSSGQTTCCVWTAVCCCQAYDGYHSQTLDRFGSSVFVYYYGYIRVYDCENHSKGLLLWARAEANMFITAARHRPRKYSTYSVPTSRPVRIDFYQLVCNDWLK